MINKPYVAYLGQPHLFYPGMMFLILRVGFWRFFVLSLVCAVILASSPDGGGGNVWAYGWIGTWVLFLPVWLLGVLIAENLHLVREIAGVFRRVPAVVMLGVLLIGLAGVCGVLAYYVPGPLKFKWTMVAFGFPAAGFVFVLLGVDYSGSRVMRFLERQGEWSYSLYLMHRIGIYMAFDCLFLLRLWLRHVGLGVAVLVLLFVLAIGGVMGILFFRLCERPAHLLAKRLARRAGAVSPVSVRLRDVGFLTTS